MILCHTVAFLTILYLKQRPGLPLHSELVVAELTEAGSWGRQPVLQTAAVDGGQGPWTFTGGQQFLLGSAVMTDTTHGVLWHGTEDKKDGRHFDFHSIGDKFVSENVIQKCNYVNQHKLQEHNVQIAGSTHNATATTFFIVFIPFKQFQAGENVQKSYILTLFQNLKLIHASS